MATEKQRDLIDRQDLIEEINRQRRASKTAFPRQSYVVGDVLTSIYNAPTVDAVVRCKDCAYWKKAVCNKKGFLICPASGMEIMADDFCSYGERRKNDR